MFIVYHDIYIFNVLLMALLYDLSEIIIKSLEF